MKRLLLLLLSAGFLHQANAQTSGTVQYSETMKMDIKVDGENAAIMDMLPKEQKLACNLYFTQEAALYEYAKKDDVEKEYEDGGNRMRIRMDAPDDKFYYDVTSQTMTQQRDFMGRKFLVEGKKDGTKWKLTGKQSELLGYPCQEAIMQDSNMTVTAWFTPAIPVPAGPSSFAGLPGLILKADVDGRHIIEATNVDLKAVANDKIKKPKEGKKMTSEQFNAMMEEKRKEMGGDGNGNVIIKIRR